MLIKNDKGEEIEVFTIEEVEQKNKEVAEKAKNEARDEFEKNNPDYTKEIEDLKKKLFDAEEALNGGDKKNGGQVDRLRQERDKAKQDLQDFIKNVDKKIEDLVGNFVGETKDDWLNKLAKNDVELRKKIEFEFDNYRSGANSKKDISERMQKAYQLATGNSDMPGIFDFSSTISDSRGVNNNSSIKNDEEYNKNERAIGTVLGISADDVKNYNEHQKKQQDLEKQGLIPPGQLLKAKK